MEKENELLQVKHLLEQTEIIDKKHKEIARITGANYNIFDVIEVDSKEVILHTRFLKDLLNPEGLHDQGNIFLNLFLRTIKNSIFKNKEAKKYLDTITTKEYNPNCNKLSNQELFKTFTKDSFVKVNNEENLGNNNFDNETGGSIDIYLKTRKGTHLVIENKIFHKDEPQQLIRYYNSVPNTIILYLKLKEESPTEISIKSNIGNPDLINNLDYYCISYKNEILSWLKECNKETIHLPHFRETLSQYINTVKNLTNQSTNDMNKELNEVIGKNYLSAKKIYDNIERVKTDKIFELFSNIKDGISGQGYFAENWILSEVGDFSNKWATFSIKHENWDKNICVIFSAEKNINANSSYFGLWTFDEENTNKDLYLNNLKEIIDVQNIYDEKDGAAIACKKIDLFLKQDIDKKLFDDNEFDKLTNLFIEMFTSLAKKINDELISLK